MASDAHLSKKERARKRNWLHNIINLVAGVHESISRKGALDTPAKEEVGSLLGAERKKREEMIWSERVGSIQNRVSGRRREATDRWNRMAGTEAAGARGR